MPHRFLLGFFLAPLFLIPLHVSAASGEGLTVTAVGEVLVMPDTAELRLLAVGQAELADDAIVKYEDSKRRATEALKALKLEGLTITAKGFSLHQGKAVRQNNAALPAQVTISEYLVLKLSGVDKLKAKDLLGSLTEIANTAKDSGLQAGSPTTNYYRRTSAPTVGPGSAVFVVSESEKHVREATSKAVAAAREKGTALAADCGVTLGGITNVSVKRVSSATTSQAYNQYGQIIQTQQSDQTSSAEFKAIPVKVSVSVTFSIKE
jgi:uncharacterized protein YggE